MLKLLKQLFYTENYLYRLFGIVVVLIVVGVMVRNWLEYRTIRDEVDQIAYREAKLLHEYFKSVRAVYDEEYIKSGVEINERTIGLLPVHTVALISNDFKERSTQGIYIRNVSDQVRNLENTPREYEREAIDYFKKNPDARERVETLGRFGKEQLFYAAPLKIEPQCLMCHGKREDAPEFIRERFSAGYGYEVGDVRGITSITVDKNRLLANVEAKYKNRAFAAILIAVVTLILVFLMVRRAVKFERRYIDNLQAMSFVDPLTNLFNRRKMNEYLGEYQGLFERYAESYALIMLDIDFFKSVNDTYGHTAGDSVLRELSVILKSSVRKTDHIARWGGEEFLIMCPKTDLEQAQEIAETIRVKIENFPFSIVGSRTVSIGVAAARGEDTTESLIKRADQALYQAKENGKNRVCTL